MNQRKAWFIELIVNHLTEQASWAQTCWYQSPFIDLAPSGLEALFRSAQVPEIVTLLEQVRAAAVAQ